MNYLRIKSIIVIVFLVYHGVSAQIDEQSVLGLPQITTAQMHAIGAPQIGSIVFNTDAQKIFRYTATGWLVDEDSQQLSLLGTTISIENGNGIDLTPLKSVFNDHPWDNPDGSIANQASTTINYSGNIGLGVPNPQENLDIAGTLRVRGLADENLNDNKVLVVDANGVVKQNDASNLAAGEWGDASNIGSANFVYAKQAKNAGYNIVVTDNGKLNLGLQLQLPEGFEPYGHLNIYNYDDRKFPLTITNKEADMPAYLYFDQEGGGSDEVMIGADFDRFGAAIFTSMTRILLGFNEQPAVTIHRNNQYMGIGEYTPTAALDIAKGPVPLRVRNLSTTTPANHKILVADASGFVKQVETKSIVNQGATVHPPKIPVVITTTGNNFTVDLYQHYANAYTTPIAKSPSSGTLGVINRTALDYYVVDVDGNIFSNVSVDNNGVMTYNVIAVPSNNLAYVTAVFQVR